MSGPGAPKGDAEGYVLLSAKVSRGYRTRSVSPRSGSSRSTSDEAVVFSTSVFEDQAAEEDSNSLAADFVKANLAELLPNPPAITAGHVTAQS